MTSWFEDPKQLVRVDKVHEFWPSKTQSSADRVNAISSFYYLCDMYNLSHKTRSTYIRFGCNCTRCSLYNGKI